MVDLILNGKVLELSKGTDIKYNITVNDIFDLSVVNSSYTNSFSVPKTDVNTFIFNQLGLVGDTSRIPYQKNKGMLNDNGITLISDGWFFVSETEDSYKCSIIDGVIDFFKEIENKTIGKDLDLSEINHTKNVASVKASFTNQNYRYILADYNGLIDLPQGLNIDYLVPSVRVKYIWDKIFSNFGWTYSGSIFSNPDFLDIWMTYSKGVSDEVNLDVLVSNNWSSFPYLYTSNTQLINIANFNSTDVNTLLSNVQNRFFKVAVNGIYRLKISGNVKSLNDNNFPVDYNVSLGKNFQSGLGTLAKNIVSGKTSDSSFESEITFYIDSSETFSILIYGNGFTTDFDVNEMYLSVDLELIESQNVDFSVSFLDFSITEFFKEQVITYGLTPIVDNDKKHIKLLTVAERLKTETAIDWSDKFVNRISEKYTYSGFASNNLIKHKYNLTDQKYNDGILVVNNENIENEKTIYQSKFYAPNQELREFYNGLNSLVIQMYDTEIKELSNGEIEVNYKSLSNRFYRLRSNTVAKNITLYSKVSSESLNVTSIALANTDRTTFDYFIPKYWNDYYRVLNDFRNYNVNLTLTIADIKQFDGSNLIYLSQENSFFLVNKITWESGTQSKAELIRVKGN